MVEFEMESKIEISEYFDSYEIDFKAIINKVKQFEKAASLNREQENLMLGLETIINDLQDADKCLRQMEVEMNMSPNSIKNLLAPRVRACRLEYQETKQRVTKLEERNTLAINKRNVLGDGNNSKSKHYEGKSKGNSGRERLLETGRLLDDANDVLQETIAMGLDTEGIGHGVQRNLKSNTESLTRTQKTSKEMEGDLKIAEQILRAIDRRLLTNKLILIFIIIFLGILILIVLYLKLRRLFLGG